MSENDPESRLQKFLNFESPISSDTDEAEAGPRTRGLNWSDIVGKNFNL